MEGLRPETAAVIVGSSKASPPVAASTTAFSLKDGKLCGEGAKCVAWGRLAGTEWPAGGWHDLKRTICLKL